MSSLKVNFLDVQHGSACHIATPCGKHYAVDLGSGDTDGSQTGGNPGPFSPLRYLKYQANVTQLEAVVITHPHTDHIDDIENFDLLSPKFLWRPKHLTEAEVRSGNPHSDKLKLDKYIEIYTRYSAPIDPAENPFHSTNNGGVEIQIFGATTPARSNLNNHSLLVILEYAGTKFLITGDQESAAWNELYTNPQFTSAVHGVDILLASHHGRESGFSEKLYEYIGEKPCLTIISDGPQQETCVADKYRNYTKGWKVRSRSGKPSQDRYCLTTRSDGTICVECGFNQPNGTAFRSVSIR